MDSILQPLTLSESRRRWQVLLDRQAQAEAWLDRCPPGRRKVKDDNHGGHDGEEEEDNPFGVGSVAIPTVHALVENLLEDYILQWQQLDFRKITDDNGTANAGPDDANEGETIAKKRRKLWHRNNQHLKMPDRFDYATRSANPPNEQGNNATTNNNATGAGTSARVMNLLDPTQSIPYEQALWELFEQVPTLEDIETQVREGHQMQHTEQIMTEICEGYQNYTRIDAHSLSQLRINDRHDMPPLFHNTTPGNNNKNLISTIRFECWRREPTRGSVADPGRAIFEFQGTQTLADVHQTIVELMEDGLWEQISSSAQVSNRRKDSNVSSDNGEPDSGYFLIEDTFYTIGSVDYVTPILNWLGDCTARKAYLGITSCALKIKPMSEAILQDIPFRLGVRYHHAHHGDVECAIFVTDRHHYHDNNNQSNRNKQPQTTKTHKNQPVYPLIHDTWTASYPSVDCEGCQKYTVAVATSNHCEISQGHRALCQECSEILLGSNNSNSANGIAEEEGEHSNSPTNDLPRDTRDGTTVATAAEAEMEEEANSEEHSSMLIQPYAVWKSQPVLSTGAGNT